MKKLTLALSFLLAFLPTSGFGDEQLPPSQQVQSADERSAPPGQNPIDSPFLQRMLQEMPHEKPADEITSQGSYAKIDLASTIYCSYQKGHYLSPLSSEEAMNSTPMKWAFNGLLSEQSSYVSGGDTGEVAAIRLGGVISIYFISANEFLSSVYSFTIFDNGVSYWNKQTGEQIMGNTNSQHYIGTCSNLKYE